MSDVKDEKEAKVEDHQVNSPEVAHRLDTMVDGSDAAAQSREDMTAAIEREFEAARERRDRALALLAPIQKVTDGNETAALASITGQVPVRDVSEAPAPEPLGIAHSE